MTNLKQSFLRYVCQTSRFPVGLDVRRAEGCTLYDEAGEGYLDCIVPFQYGIKNIVATLGTALTPEQARLIKRFSKTVVIVFDADTAGEEAALRGLDVLVSMDLNVRVAALPRGHDPDSFVRTYGKDAFLKIIRTHRKSVRY